MKPNVLYNGIAHFFMLLFIYTGVAKFMEMNVFRQEIIASPLLSSMAGFISWALPVAEILLVLVLFIPAWRLKGLYASLALMGLFSLYLLGILFIDDHLTCSCSGMIEDLTPRQHLIFNISCIVLAVIGIHAGRRQAQAPSPRYRWLSTTLSLLLLGSIGWIVLTAANVKPIAKTGFEGHILPAFELKLADSLTQLNTGDIPTGNPFIMIGFSPYCPHCQGEIRDITRNIRQLGDTHIYLLTTFPMADLQKFYACFQLEKYPTITAGVDSSNHFLSSFHLHMIPFTAIYDGKKRLAQGIAGRVDMATLTRCIKE